MGKSEEDLLSLPPVPEGYKLLTPQAPKIPTPGADLPPMPEGFQLVELPKIPDFYKPESPIPQTIPPEMIELMWKGMGETSWVDSMVVRLALLT